MLHVKWKWAFALLFVTTLTACKKDPIHSTPIDLSKILLENFQLEETNIISIDITHPVLSNGVETVPGDIFVTVPSGSALTSLTPKVSNFTNNAFTVTPALGQSVVYEHYTPTAPSFPQT